MSNTVGAVLTNRVAIEDSMEGIALETDKVPSVDQLYDAWSLLASVNEYFVDRVLLGVIATAERKAGGPECTFTYEQIGQLLKWADDMRNTAETLTMNVVKTAACVLLGGYDDSGVMHADGAPFKKYGHPKPDWGTAVSDTMRRLGVDWSEADD